MIYMVITFKDYDNALHVIAPKCCHIVAMGMPLLRCPTLSLQVFLIKLNEHEVLPKRRRWRAIAEKPAEGEASMLV